MPPIISIKNLSKKYDSGTHALKDVSLDIREGEIFALLGPNGAGKTTLIGATTGIVTHTSGSINVMGKDVVKDYRFTRSMIGLVPQEIHLDIFLSVEQILANQRGFYGKPKNPKLLERIMKQLSLWDKRHDETRFLSGGMKRRVLIGKALTNEPKILFLDEPTAGVDVELRKDMWRIVKELKQQGTTIILTTHYIEEAELLADRIGIINGGELMLVEEKETLMRRMGEKTLVLHLEKPIDHIPNTLEPIIWFDQKMDPNSAINIQSTKATRRHSLKMPSQQVFPFEISLPPPLRSKRYLSHLLENNFL